MHPKLRSSLAASILILGGALLACKSEVSGKLTVNSAEFKIAKCYSGQANIVQPFHGVIFVGEGEQKMHIVGKENGGFNVFYFNSGENVGNLVGQDCGSLNLKRTNTQVNGIYNVEGSVSLDCASSIAVIKGDADFKNCH